MHWLATRLQARLLLGLIVVATREWSMEPDKHEWPAFVASLSNRKRMLPQIALASFVSERHFSRSLTMIASSLSISCFFFLYPLRSIKKDCPEKIKRDRFDLTHTHYRCKPHKRESIYHFFTWPCAFLCSSELKWPLGRVSLAQVGQVSFELKTRTRTTRTESVRDLKCGMNQRVALIPHG